MKLLGCLNKAGLVCLFEDLLRISHKATVFQHALILLHLPTELVQAPVPRLLNGPQHFRLPLLESLKEKLEVFIGLSFCKLAVFLHHVKYYDRRVENYVTSSGLTLNNVLLSANKSKLSFAAERS